VVSKLAALITRRSLPRETFPLDDVQGYTFPLANRTCVHHRAETLRAEKIGALGRSLTEIDRNRYRTTEQSAIFPQPNPSQTPATLLTESAPPPLPPTTTSTMPWRQYGGHLWHRQTGAGCCRVETGESSRCFTGAAGP